MRALLQSIEAEFHRYQALADAAMAQLSEAELSRPGPGDNNSVVTIAWHVAGNLASRFTDFLTTDGEKPWRKRDQEFLARTPSREELRAHWERGWSTLFAALAELNDELLAAHVTIRGTELTVAEALQRSLAHTSYHVGQIVYLAKCWRGAEWQYLSIPPGHSAAYNRNPTREAADAHASALKPETPR
jgi:uncharacterized damage-inducible protein DinB